MDRHFQSMGSPVRASPSSSLPTKSQAFARKNAQWNPRENRVFIAACEAVIADGHRNGKYFTKHGWDTLLRLFNSNSGHDWSKRQLKNHWDSLRQKHKRFQELLDCTGVEYASATGRISASEEWWARKIKENKEYKDFKDKDCREVYGYKDLFGDAFDNAKYAVTPSKLCKTGFAMFDDSGYDDMEDSVPTEEESSASSDEAEPWDKTAMSMEGSRPRSGDKRKSVVEKKKGKRKKNSSSNLSYSVDRATSASERVAAKLDKLVGPEVPDAKTCIKEMLATGRLQKKTDMYFWTCTFLSLRRNRETLEAQEDAQRKWTGSNGTGMSTERPNLCEGCTRAITPVQSG